LGPQGKALLEKVHTLRQRLQKLEGARTPQQVKTAGAMSKARRLLRDMNSTTTQLGRAVHNIKGGVKLAQDLARQYNRIAQWCGLPVVPDLLLGKKG